MGVNCKILSTFCICEHSHNKIEGNRLQSLILLTSGIKQSETVTSWLFLKLLKKTRRWKPSEVGTFVQWDSWTAKQENAETIGLCPVSLGSAGGCWYCPQSGGGHRRCPVDTTVRSKSLGSVPHGSVWAQLGRTDFTDEVRWKDYQDFHR